MFSPSYQPSPGSSPTHFSLSSSPVPVRRRKEPPLPHSWVNSDADYVPLIPITLIALLTLYVLYLCLPTEQQFLSTFSSSPSALTPFHLWLSPHTPPALPHPSPPFAGRSRQLASLHAQLFSTHTATIVGRPGSGKTALALAYIAQIIERPTTPPHNVILVLSASSSAALAADLALLHASLSLPLVTAGDRGVRESIATFIGGFGRWLVVFDDCRMADDEARAWLPRRRGREGEGLIGDVVFIRDETDSDSSSRRPVGAVVTGAMGSLHAVRLLARVSGVAVTNDTTPDLSAIVTLLERLPQTIVLAGLYMRQNAMPAELMTYAVRLQMAPPALAPSITPLTAVVRVILALPQFNASKEALSDLSLLCDHCSSLPLALVPPSFPLSLYASYGLMHTAQRWFPYSHFHHLLFASTESKTATVHVLTALMDAIRPTATHTPRYHAQVQRSLDDSGLADVVALEALSFLHRPFLRDVQTHFESGAPPLPVYPFPPPPSFSLSSFHSRHALSSSSAALIHSTFGSASSPAAVSYSRAQAASFIPPLHAFLRTYREQFANLTLRISSTDDLLSVTPQHLSAVPPQPLHLVAVLTLVACYDADMRRDYATAHRDLVIASALALHAEDDEAVARSLLLLAVHQLTQNDTANARSLLTFLHQRFLSSSSPTAASPLPLPLQADVLSALAVSHSTEGGDATLVDQLFRAAMATRHQIADRTALVHAFACRDFLLHHPSLTAASLSAHLACEHIEVAVFGAQSYAAAARSLALAHAHAATNLTLACGHAVAASTLLYALPSSPTDYRLPLGLLQLAHLLTLPSPSSPPSLAHTARSTLDSLFALHASAHPRGAGLYSPTVLSVATEVLARERDWIAAMDVVRQGYEVSRGRGEGEDGWRAIFQWLFSQNERDKAEERKREEERLRQEKLEEERRAAAQSAAEEL